VSSLAPSHTVRETAIVFISQVLLLE